MKVDKADTVTAVPFVKIVLTQKELNNLMYHLRNTVISGDTYKLYNELYDFIQENGDNG